RVQPALLRPQTRVSLTQRVHDLRAVERQFAQPAFPVAPDPGRVWEAAQASDRLERPRRPRREVAAEQVAVGTGGLRITEDFLERNEIAVDVVQDGEHAR